MIRKTIIFCILLFINTSIYSQNSFIRNFSPEEYQANSQNWSVVQDHRGIMYFANNDGILEYDGSNWILIVTPAEAHSLAIDKNNKIFVGLDRDFGYLQSDNNARLHYISLKNKIPQQYRDLKQVWNISVLGNKIVFATNDKLLVLQNDTINVLMSNTKFENTFLVNDKLYVLEKEEGLFCMQNDSLYLLSVEKEIGRKNIRAMLPFENNDILIVTYQKGAFVFNPNKSPVLWKPKGFSDIDEFIIKNKTYCGTSLYNGNFAIGATINGIITFDKQGNIISHYNKQSGLQSNTALYLFTDLNGQLWTALGEGISLISNNLPFKNYTDKDGLDGTIYCVKEFKNKLYVGTGNNLYVKNHNNKFEIIDGTIGQNFFLLEANNKLLLGNGPNGIFDIENKNALQLKTLKNICPILAIKLQQNPNYILTQLWDKGLAIIEYKNRQWLFKNLIKGFEKRVQSFVEDNYGNFWVNANDQLYKLRLNKRLDSVIFYEKYTADKFNLQDSYITPYRLNNGEILFSTYKGIYSYIPEKDVFKPNPNFPMFTETVYNINQDINGNIWFEQYKKGNISEKGVLRLIDGKYKMIKTPFLKFSDRIIPYEYSLYPLSDSLVYIGTNKGLLEYHPKQEVNYDIPFNTLIRSIFVNDSLFYGGAISDTSSMFRDKIILEHKDNNLFFHYAATFYEDSKKNLFSYRLIGSLDTTWSDWTVDSKKEYTNLNAGEYVFEVKSQNIYKKYGSTAYFAFKVLPPWYYTWWAYIIYGILAIVFVSIIIHLHSARLEHNNELLKQTVKERTEDILEQKNKILQQKEDLEEKSKKLKDSNDKLNLLNSTKDKFFAIISHDLRNPFNSILGFTDLLNSEYDSIDDSERKEIIKSLGKSSRSAYALLENLLTWAQTQRGKIEIHKKMLNLKELVETSVSPYMLNASLKNIKIIIDVSSDVELFIDRNTSITIIQNLVNNALKFTPNDGTVTIRYQENKDNLELRVIDTGVGMSSEVVEKLFRIDYDISTQGTNNEKGTGLGLILCKEFVQKNGGDISVRSKVGKGSEFIVTFPKSSSNACLV